MIEHDPSRSPNAEAVARTIVSEWRRLTDGGTRRDHERRTLVACSGGRDSVSLAAALGRVAPGSVVLGHVMHDLRAGILCERDRDSVRSLASELGCKFVERSVCVASTPGNDEANARSARYDALLELAIETGCGFVATGHHAEDQLETVLMGLLRGAGPRGLAGMHPSRTLGDCVALIRPALGIRREELSTIAIERGHDWCEDETNADESRLRARLRSLVVPELFSLRDGLGDRLAEQGASLTAAADALDHLAGELLECGEVGDGSSFEWEREKLRTCDPGVLRAALRVGVHRFTGGEGIDQLRARSLRHAVAAARDRSGEAKTLILSACSLTLTKDRARLALRETTSGSPIMADYDGRTVHLVGHCGPDTFMLTNAIRRALPGVEIASANSTQDLIEATKTSSILLVNRVLDGGFENDSGIGLIRSLASDDAAPAIMLISNFDDAQEEAEAAGAVPGFGKTDMGSPEANAKLVAAMAKVSA